MPAKRGVGVKRQVTARGEDALSGGHHEISLTGKKIVRIVGPALARDAQRLGILWNVDVVDPAFRKKVVLLEKGVDAVEIAKGRGKGGGLGGDGHGTGHVQRGGLKYGGIVAKIRLIGYLAEGVGKEGLGLQALPCIGKLQQQSLLLL